jgi:hypothetical protein
MSTENAQRLTPEDPVDGETLSKLGELEDARNQIGSQLLDIKQEEVKLVASSMRLEEQRHRIFEKVLMDRGLPPNTVAEVDAKTGRIIIHRSPTAPAAVAPVVAEQTATA